MADTFIKQASGEYIKDSNGIYLKSRPFNQQVIQSGLSFWGSSDPSFLTIVDGKISEAYDIRNTGIKMTQPTVLSRPELSGWYINFKNLQTLTIASQSVKTVFIVMKVNAQIATSGGGLISGVGNTVFGALLTNTFRNLVSNVQRPFYANISKINSTFTFVAGTTYSYTSLYEITTTSASMSIGVFNNATWDISVLEWGWYNRVLTEQEVVYNQNALNAKYLIF